MKLKDIAKKKRKQWLKLGGMIATTIVQDADKGISQDPDGKKFPPYKKSYAEKKKIGKAGLKGPSSDRQINPPNLRLSGSMLNSIKAQRPTTESVEIFYRDGLKVLGNRNPPAKLKKAKRNILGLNNKNIEHVANFIEENLNDNIKKFNKKDLIIDINV